MYLLWNLATRRNRSYFSSKIKNEMKVLKGHYGAAVNLLFSAQHVHSSIQACKFFGSTDWLKSHIARDKIVKIPKNT